MADAVTSQTLVDNDKTLVMKFTNISDGTGESAVKKVDVSALNTNGHGQTCTSVTFFVSNLVKTKVVTTTTVSLVALKTMRGLA